MKLIDSQYLEHRQMAVWLVRLCYPIARSIEEKQPAATLKFLEAGFAARHEIAELAIGLPPAELGEESLGPGGSVHRPSVNVFAGSANIPLGWHRTETHFTESARSTT